MKKISSKSLKAILPALLILTVSCNSVPKAEEKITEEAVEDTKIEEPAPEKQETEPEAENTEVEIISQEEPEIIISEPEIPEENVKTISPFTDFTEPEVFDLPPEPEKTADEENSPEASAEKPEQVLLQAEEKPSESETEISQPEQAEAEESAQPDEPQTAAVETEISDKTEKEFSEPEQTPAISEIPEIKINSTADNSAEDNSNDNSVNSDNSIEETEKEAESQEAEEQPEIQPEEPKPSRSITIKRKQYLDVEYPGSGWYYMGENIKENKMVLFGRKVASEKNPNTSFTLRSRFEGTTLLHFYKNDLLTGRYIDDYLEVIIENDDADSKEHIKAPSYEEIVPPAPDFSLLKEENSQTLNEIEQNADSTLPVAKAPMLTGKTNIKNTAASPSANQSNSVRSEDSNSDKGGRTKIQTTAEAEKTQDSQSERKPSAARIQKAEETPAESPKSQISTENMSVQAILEQAQKEYDNGQFEKSLQLITDFFEKSDLNLDRALYLQGQILEAKSPVQDIKSAIDAYDAIVKNYRQSPFWKKANERSLYLKRFYINIR